MFNNTVLYCTAQFEEKEHSSCRRPRRINTVQHVAHSPVLYSSEKTELQDMIKVFKIQNN